MAFLRKNSVLCWREMEKLMLFHGLVRPCSHRKGCFCSWFSMIERLSVSYGGGFRKTFQWKRKHGSLWNASSAGLHRRALCDFLIIRKMIKCVHMSWNVKYGFSKGLIFWYSQCLSKSFFGIYLVRVWPDEDNSVLVFTELFSFF